MRPFITRFASVLFAMLSVTSPASADEDYIVPSLGWAGIGDQEDEEAQVGLEYRLAPIYYIRPVAGVTINTDDTSSYGYIGLNADIPIVSRKIYFIPSFNAGVYGKGDGKDLGGTYEFRSGIEIAYQMEDEDRIGIQLNHTGNMGIYRHNPGTETLLINYALPSKKLFGN